MDGGTGLGYIRYSLAERIRLGFLHDDRAHAYRQDISRSCHYYIDLNHFNCNFLFVGLGNKME